MSLFYVWSVLYRVLQLSVLYSGWVFLAWVTGVPARFSFVGKCMVFFRFLSVHFLFAFLFLLCLLVLWMFLYWLDNKVCAWMIGKGLSDGCDDDLE